MACHQGHRGSTSYRWWEGINFNEPDRNLMGAGAIFHLTLFRSGSSFWSTRPEPDPLPSLNTGMWGGSDLHMTNSSSHCRTVAPTCWYWGGRWSWSIAQWLEERSVARSYLRPLAQQLEERSVARCYLRPLGYVEVDVLANIFKSSSQLVDHGGQTNRLITIRMTTRAISQP
jgi:hypothetical protein